MTLRRFDLIAFDWDGTLFDSTAIIARCIQAAVLDVGGKKPSDEAASYVIGLGWNQALAHVAPEVSPERYPLLSERYRHHYFAIQHEISLFDGVLPMLAALRTRGHLLAVATGKSRLGLERALDHSGLRPLFLSSRCADECHSKPHPQMLEELMAEFGVMPEATLMIGDTSHDLLMASNAGVDALGVT